jgi:hypothetical protein
VISYKEGLYLATLGGARALGIDVSQGTYNHNDVPGGHE